MNRERLLRVADAIANLPYEGKLDGFGKPKAFNMASGCGSACCIGGWTGEIFRGRWVPLPEARAILGLNQDQAAALMAPPGFACMEHDGRTGSHVLRLMAAAGDGVTGKQIRAFWRNPWA